MRNNVRMKTAMLMILVMAVLSACGGENGKVDTLPIPTAVAETGSDVLETVTAEMTTTKDTVETEESVAEESVTETAKTTQVMIQTDSETSITESETETGDDADSTVTPENVQPEMPKESDVELVAAVEIKQEDPKVIHTHNYVGSIAVNSGCETTGVMAYTCSCEDNYTEPIPATGHTWTTTTETVHHPSLGHMERTEKKVITIQCNCGFTTQSTEEYNNHRVNEGHGNYGCGSITKTIYEDNWIVTQEEYDEVVTKTACTVCGLTQ